MNLPDSVCGYCGKTGTMDSQYPATDIFDNQYFIGRCSFCRAYSLYPRPEQALLNKAYNNSYYGEHEQKFTFPLVEKVLDWFRESRGRQLCRFLHDGDTVLDLGCGNGKFLLSLIKRKKINAWGIEPPGNSANRASALPGIHIKVGTLEPGDFKPCSLQAVTLFHVFEHLVNPIEILDIIDKILVKDGILMISFPNIASWQSRIFKGQWLHLDPPRHLFFLEPKNFRSIMEQRGYKLLRQYYASLEQNPYGMVQSILNCFSVKREILFESMKGNIPYVKDYPKVKLILQKLFFFISFPIFIITNAVAALCRKGATVEFTFQKLN